MWRFATECWADVARDAWAAILATVAAFIGRREHGGRIVRLGSWIWAPCPVRQYGDETRCEACGLRWDTNDPEPPVCRGGW